MRYHWWQCEEADTFGGAIEIQNADKQDSSFTVPGDADDGQTIHVICEVRDDGSPAITRYQRVVLTVTGTNKDVAAAIHPIEIPRMAAQFPLDGGNGTVVAESVGGMAGKPLNADPAVSWIAGTIDGAVHLDGDDDHIVIPHSRIRYTLYC